MMTFRTQWYLLFWLTRKSHLGTCHKASPDVVYLPVFRAVVRKWFYVLGPLPRNYDEKNWYRVSENVVKNVVKYAQKCAISQQKLQKFSPNCQWPLAIRSSAPPLYWTPSSKKRNSGLRPCRFYSFLSLNLHDVYCKVCIRRPNIKRLLKLQRLRRN